MSARYRPSRWRLSVPSSTLVLLATLLLLALQPLLTGHVPWQGDGQLHLYRLGALERAVRAGDLFPRWSADLAYGFGFPLFHYYAPFAYYVGLIPRLAGFSLGASLQASYALAVLTLAVGVTLWTRVLWPAPRGKGLAGVTAVAAVLYAPYILINAYHRAALAELWGLAWLVNGLWSIHRSARDWRSETRDGGHLNSRIPVSPFGCIAGLSIALLALSHNITAMVGIPLLATYGVLVHIRKPRSAIWNLFFPLLLGLGLAAFFWIPAFLERGDAQIENVTAGANFAYVNHFLSLADLIAWPKTAVPSQVNPPIPRGLGCPAVGLAVLAWLPWKSPTRKKRLPANQSTASGPRALAYYRLLLTLVALASLFMTLPSSQFIWDALPLLPLVQFPWRFLGLASIAVAMLAELGAQNLASGFELAVLRFRPSRPVNGYRFVTTGIVLILSVYALTWLFPGTPPPLPTATLPQDIIRFEAETGWLGTTSGADFLPRSVKALPPSDSLLPRYDAAPSGAFISRLNRASLPETISVLSQEERYTSTTLVYSSSEAVPITFDRFYFPGWRATVDGKSITPSASEPNGLITAVLPSGNHMFCLTFGSTALRTAANVLSLTFLLLLVFLVFHYASSVNGHPLAACRRPVPRLFENSAKRTEPESRAWRFAVFYSLPLLLLGLFLLKTFYLDRADTPFRRDPFDGRTVAGTEASTHANFGNELVLLGFDLTDEPIPADQPIPVTLYWSAVPPVAAEYSVSVHLLTTNGRRYAQSDSFHPAGLPVTRWQANEFGVDAHRLALVPAAPAGDYRIILYVYDSRTGQRLELLDEAGLPKGDEYPLATVRVGPPKAFPDPALLPIAHRTTEGDGCCPFLSDDVQLLGFDQPIAAPEVGHVLPLTLYWYTPHSPAQNPMAELWLECHDSGIVSRMTIGAPGTDWLPGQIQRADHDLLIGPVAEDGHLVESGLCSLQLGMSTTGGAQTIALQTFALGVPERVFDLPPDATVLGERLANLVTLAAFTLDASTLTPGQPLNLTLYWEPHGITTTDYTAFVQLLGPDGRPIAQQDQIPGNGRRPTTGWLPSEFVHDDYTLTLPPAAPPGVYQLICGLYDARSGERLQLDTGVGDAIVIPVKLEVE